MTEILGWTRAENTLKGSGESGKFSGRGDLRRASRIKELPHRRCIYIYIYIVHLTSLLVSTCHHFLLDAPNDWMKDGKQREERNAKSIISKSLYIFGFTWEYLCIRLVNFVISGFICHSSLWWRTNGESNVTNCFGGFFNNFSWFVVVLLVHIYKCLNIYFKSYTSLVWVFVDRAMSKLLDFVNAVIKWQNIQIMFQFIWFCEPLEEVNKKRCEHINRKQIIKLYCCNCLSI